MGCASWPRSTCPAPASGTYTIDPEVTQNLLSAYLAMAVFAGLAANTLWGAWWLDGVVALGIAGWAVVEGRRAWAGRSCGCTCQPGRSASSSSSPSC